MTTPRPIATSRAPRLGPARVAPAWALLLAVALALGQWTLQVHAAEHAGEGAAFAEHCEICTIAAQAKGVAPGLAAAPVATAVAEAAAFTGARPPARHPPLPFRSRAPPAPAQS